MPDSSRRTSRACKQIVRYIHICGLKIGDSLPPQQELRKVLHFSNDTLTTAMGKLVSMGILSRYCGRGTSITNLSPIRTMNWTIGLAGMVAPETGPGAFFGDLFHRLLGKLSRANCRCNTYFIKDAHHWPPVLEDFPGLAEDLDEHRLDGIIILTELVARQLESCARDNVPVYHVGTSNAMPAAFLVDYNAMVTEALALFGTRGERRILIVDSSAVFANVIHCRMMAASPAGWHTAETITANYRIDHIVTGRNIGEAILAMPREQRPDGIIFTEDYIAVSATGTMVRDGCQPTIAVLTNRQLPLTFPVPVTRFEIDIDALAEQGFHRFMALLLNPSLPPLIDYIQPRVVD